MNELDVLIEEENENQDEAPIQTPLINVQLITDKEFPNIDELIQSAASIKESHPKRRGKTPLNVEGFLISMTPTAGSQALSPTRAFSPELSEISVLDYKHAVTMEEDSDNEEEDNISRSSDSNNPSRVMDESPLPSIHSFSKLDLDQLAPGQNSPVEGQGSSLDVNRGGLFDKLKGLFRNLWKSKDELDEDVPFTPVKSEMFLTTVYVPKEKASSLEEIHSRIKMEANELEYFLEALLNVFEHSKEKLKKNRSIMIESVKSLEDLTSSVNNLKRKVLHQLRHKTQFLRDKYQIFVNDLTVIDEISENPFGDVTRVFDKNKKQFYSLRRIRKTKAIPESHFEIYAMRELLTYLMLYETENEELLKVYAIEYNIEANEYYFVLETGYGTLRTFMEFFKEKQIPWTTDTIKSFGLQMNHQIQLLKHLGIFHRDIKPDNIIITKDLRFKLSNFDCAIIKGSFNLDEVYDVLGTPYYMAPEIRYYFKKCTPAKYDLCSADVYSVAATICEMLTGNERLPEDNINHITESYDIELCELVNQIFMQRMFCYSMKEKDYMDFFVKHKPDYEEFFKWRLLQKFLAEDRLLNERRLLRLGLFSDIEDMLNKRLIEAQTNINIHETCVCKINLAQVYKEQGRVNKCFNILQEVKPSIPKREKMMNIMRLKIKAELFLINGRSEKAILIYKRMKKLFSKYFNPKELFMADLHNSIAQIYKTESRYLKCVKHYSKALQIYIDHSDHKHPEIGSLCEHIGIIYEYQKNYKEAKKYYDRALNRNRAAFSDKHPKVALILGRIGVINLKEKRWTEALYYQQRALEIHMSYSGPGSRDTAGTYAHIATIYSKQQRYADAINYYFNSIEIYLNYGEDQKEVAILCEHIGNIYCKLKRYVDAIPYFRKALETKRELYTDIHPQIALSFSRLGDIHYKAGHIFESVQNYVNALEVDKRVFGENNPKIGHHYYGLGKTYEKKGEIQQAMKNFMAALDIYMINYLECRDELAKTYTRMGCIYEAEGKTDEAVHSYLEAWDIFGRNAGHETIESGVVAVRLGVIYEAMGKKNKSVVYFEKAAHIYSKHYGSGDSRTGEIYGKLGKMLEETGKRKEGYQMMEKSLSIHMNEKPPKKSTFTKKISRDWV